MIFGYLSHAKIAWRNLPRRLVTRPKCRRRVLRATTIKTVKRITLGIALLLVSLVLTVQVIGWDWAKNYVEYRVTQATGREFTIAGDLDIDLSLHPLIRAETIRLDNAPWARFQNLAEIETLALRVDLVALIQRRIVIPQISISKPVVRLTASKRGPGSCWPLRFF
jgi:uncharacterized protein involved in outer membrane biogenesis